MAIDIGRRQLISALGGAAVAWPFAARAQPDRMRRVGVLMGSADDSEGRARIAAFQQALQELGWADGRNVRVDYRWAAAVVEQTRTFAKQLIELQPDVILAETTPVVTAVLQESRTIPVVFINVSDPVGSGFIASLAHPGGTATGFMSNESSLGAKWLQLLKEIAPGIRRAELLFNPVTAPYAGDFLRSAEAAAPSFGVSFVAASVQEDAGIEAALAALGREPGSGLIVMADIFNLVHYKQIVAGAAQYSLPAIYPFRFFATDGGLLSYGADVIDLFRRSASYVDRILKGEKPADLPVQAPIKFELVINLKTAKALGLDVPPQLLATADEVIE
jgi:putative tryptophan/tyrosine transport system substrate-binding protein